MVYPTATNQQKSVKFRITGFPATFCLLFLFTPNFNTEQQFFFWVLFFLFEFLCHGKPLQITPGVILLWLNQAARGTWSKMFREKRLCVLHNTVKLTRFEYAFPALLGVRILNAFRSPRAPVLRIET